MKYRTIIGFVLLNINGMCCVAAEPRIENPSFEADVFKTYPGLARLNGDRIGAWQFEGSVGINPIWAGAPQRTGATRPYVDNGVTPHGRQVALMQNLCSLSQTLGGFQPGRQYRVTYYENARHTRRTTEPPRLVVMLGGQVIVSEHEVRCVDRPDRFALAYDYVESAPFTAPGEGPFELVFKTTTDGGVTVLIDLVAITSEEPLSTGP